MKRIDLISNERFSPAAGCGRESGSRLPQSRGLICLLALFCILFAASAQAQWKNESYSLKGGWNSIYLHGDASYDTIENLFTAAVEEIWRWNPNDENTVQFTESPLIPSAGKKEWTVWYRTPTGGQVNSLSTLTGPAAYLVKCSGTIGNSYPVTLKQSHLLPANSWVRNGANLLGFPAKTSGGNPKFSTYFATFPAAIAANTKIFKYIGGPLGPSNPLQIFSPTMETLDRSQGYWFSAEVVGNFYAPVEISVNGTDGLAFGRTGSIITALIRNRTSATVTLTVTQQNSLSEPSGEPGVTGPVPLTRRTYNTGTQSWDEAPIGVASSFSELIGPNSTVELSFGINRADASMTSAAAGAYFASFLKLTDSSNLMEFYVPASATKASLAGLWVGDISVTNVGNKVTNPARATSTVTNGVVTSIAIDGSGGYGYETAPTVTIAPPPASVQATATSTRTGAAVTGITITDRGSGYATAPTVTIAPPTSGTTATATATIEAGVIKTITIGAQGSGYTSDPVITISTPPAAGSAATATATVASGAVTQITLNTGGSGYAIGSPAVTIDAPPPLTGTTTPRPFSLRTLLHVPDSGNAALLSQVFIGQLAAEPNPVGLCTLESLLKQDAKATAARLTAAHMPLKQVITSGSGTVGLGSVLTRVIQTPYNDATNPFVHQYHPDHDNKKPGAKPSDPLYPAGVESYDITRTCEFTFTASPPPGSDVTSGWGSTVIGGTYREIISGVHRDSLQVDGTFELRRASEDGTLVTTP